MLLVYLYWNDVSFVWHWLLPETVIVDIPHKIHKNPDDFWESYILFRINQVLSVLSVNESRRVYH